MARKDFARIWFGATAAAAFAGLIVQLLATYDVDAGFFDGRWERVFNVFSFFTIQSNILVAVTCTILALGNPSSAAWFRTIRLLSTIAITLTFAVFYAVLRDDQDLSGKAAVADFLLHTVSPLMCIAGWLLFGPRRLIDRVAIRLSVAYLLVWGVFTLVRGEIVGFYPYPFMNVTEHGYTRVALNLVVVGAVFAGLGFGAWRLDRFMAARHLGDHVAVAGSPEPTPVWRSNRR